MNIDMNLLSTTIANLEKAIAIWKDKDLEIAKELSLTLQTVKNLVQPR